MEGKWYQVFHDSDGKWIPDYIFDLQARRIEEYEPMALYHQTAAESPFTQKRLISLPRLDGGRVSISGKELKITAANGEQQIEALEDEQAFQRALAQYFGFSLPSNGPA
jgi:N-hydroxyarylamine O-acetyltransferase